MQCSKDFTIVVESTTPPPVLTILQNTSPELSWSQAFVPTTNEIWRDRNGGGFVLVDTIAGALTTWLDPTPLDNTIVPLFYDYRRYKVIPDGGPVESNIVAGEFEYFFPGMLLNISDAELIISWGIFAMTEANTVETVNLPNLKYIMDDALFDQMLAIPTLTIPSLEFVGGLFSTTNNPVMTSLTLPVCNTVMGDVFCDSDLLLADVLMPAMIFRDGQSAFFDNDNLTDISVNHLLARGIVSTVTTWSFTSFGGTSSPPTGQGVIDAGILTGQGNSIITN